MKNIVSKFCYVLMVVFMLNGCAKPENYVDFNNLLLPSSPNYYLACPAGYCNNRQQEQSPFFPMNLTQLESIWQKTISAMPRTKIIYNNPASNEYSYIQRSRWLRFPDYIYVKLIPLSKNQSTLIIYSRSKYGYSDLGVNKRRVTSLISQLNNNH